MNVDLRDSMIGRKYLAGILMLMVFLFTGISLLARNVQSKPARQSAIEAFSKGNYELAYRQFSELLVSYPKDPLYKYYSGVCLVKLEKEPEEAEILLKQAQQGASVVRTIPADALFWLGRARQLSGKYPEAISSYNSFSEQAGKKAARELKIAEYIQQCNNKKGQITQEALAPGMVAGKNKSITKPESDRALKENVSEQVIARQKSVKETLPSGYDRILSEALDYQHKADSVYRIADDLKKKLDKANLAEKAALRSEIAEAGNLAASFQKQADQKYKEAQSDMNPDFFTKDIGSDQKGILKPDSTGVKRENVSPVIKSSKPDNLRDTSAIKPAENKARQDSVIKPPVKPAVTPVRKNVEVFSVFEVIQKPVYGKNEKIEINPGIPPGLIYRIQLAVFRNPVAPSYFKGISPVYGFKATGTDRTNYYAGMFRRLADAKKALTAVKQKGFKDAFIVSFSGGKVVSAERAVVLEKEWARKPFTTGIKSAADTLKDTIPPALLFRVEVIRSLKPVKDDVMDGLKKISGSRGLEIITLDDGNTICLIGKFITFDSAEEYAGLLIRNGYRNAKVVAWLGNKEIPVETAKQLFEKLE